MRDVAAGGTVATPVQGDDPRTLRGGARGPGSSDRGHHRPTVTLIAHGIGVVRDLPIPAAYFFVGAAVVLAASFVLLFYLWRRPLLEAHARGRALPRTLSRVLLSRAVRIVLGAISVGLLGLTFATALFGTTVELLNFAPTFIYIDLLAGDPAPLRPVRERVERPQPVESARRCDGVAARAERARGAARARVVGALGEVPGGGGALRVRRARARASAAGLSADARDRGRALLVLGARRDGGVRPRRLDAIRGGLRRRIRAPRTDRPLCGA